MMTGVYAEKNINVNKAEVLAWISTIRSLCLAVLITFILSGRSNAFFLQVTNGAGISEAVGKELIAQTTTQFNSILTINPLASNTYTIKLLGLNPNYVPLNLGADAVMQLQVFPYAAGMYYERSNISSLFGNFMSLCDDPGTFQMVTMDSTTCQGVLGFMDNFIITQTSGVAVVPNPLVGL